MNKKNKANINSKQIAVLIKTLVIIVSITILAYAGYFLYENLYQVITQSEEIVKLQNSINQDTINIKKFDEIVEIIEKKSEKKDIEILKNPFY